jgi:hypothetical protein
MEKQDMQRIMEIMARMDADSKAWREKIAARTEAMDLGVELFI